MAGTYSRETDVLVIGGGPGGYMAAIRLGQLGRRASPPTYPAFFPLLPLDRIFVCPTEAQVTIHAENSSAARVCSDHLPLHASVIIP